MSKENPISLFSFRPVMKRPNSARPAPPKIIKTATSLEDMNAK